MSAEIDVRVDLESFMYVRRQLFAFDKELLGKLNSRIKRAVQPVAVQAEATASALASFADKNGRPSGMARKYQRGKKGVRVQVGGRRRGDGTGSIVRMYMENGAAAMAEFAANAPSGTASAQALVDKFERTFGGTGRIAWEAMDQHEAMVLAEIRSEIDKTEAEFTARLAAGESKGVLR